MSRKIVDVKATGHGIVVELLGADEIIHTTLKIDANTKVEAPQAYILDIGPSVVRENYGIAVGDRVLFSGMMTPLPKGDFSNRQRGVIEAHSIKAVLREESSIITTDF